MIIKDSEAAARLSSPMNLINQLRCGTDKKSKKNDAMSLFGIGRKTENKPQPLAPPEIDRTVEAIKPFNPFPDCTDVAISNKIELEPTLDSILENHESQIKLGLAHDKALELLNRSVEMLSIKLDDVSASKLPAVISAASKTVESIRKERAEAAKNGKDREVHYHFYTPVQRKVEDFEVVEVQ